MPMLILFLDHREYFMRAISAIAAYSSFGALFFNIVVPKVSGKSSYVRFTCTIYDRGGNIIQECTKTQVRIPISIDLPKNLDRLKELLEKRWLKEQINNDEIRTADLTWITIHEILA